MNFRLFFRLFLGQCLMNLFVLGILLACAHYFLPYFSISFLYQNEIWNVRLFIWILAIIVALNLVFSFYIAVHLSSVFEEVRAKINWLLLGKYHHTIFDSKSVTTSWYDNEQLLASDIDHLRQRLIHLTSDLQEFTSAPVFLGEKTKEEVIESERSRIARELHDSVSQELFAAMMLLSAINYSTQGSLPSPVDDQLKKVNEVINDAQTEMRALLLHLRPIDLQGKSLKQGIEQLLRELQHKVALEITWNLDDPEIETGMEDHLFRIVQEGISNTMRHAKAKKLDVYLSASRDTVSIRIVDDGKGFDLKEKAKLGSYGLSNIEERAKGMGGRSNIISSPGQGTILTVTVPYKPLFNHPA